MVRSQLPAQVVKGADGANGAEEAQRKRRKKIEILHICIRENRLSFLFFGTRLWPWLRRNLPFRE